MHVATLRNYIETELELEVPFDDDAMPTKAISLKSLSAALTEVLRKLDDERSNELGEHGQHVAPKNSVAATAIAKRI